MPSELEIAVAGFSYEAQRFLTPPVKFFGIPAMRILGDEILHWDNKKCFDHMLTYAKAPPLLLKTFENSHGMRFWQSDVLKVLGTKYSRIKWVEASTLFRQFGKAIMKLCEDALRQDKQEASKNLEIAETEEEAYKLLESA